MSELGNFYCIPESCGRIVWTTYKKQLNIRYRYEGENWSVLNADDFQIIDNTSGQCPDKAYELFLKVQMAGRNYYPPGEREIICSFAWFGTFDSVTEGERFSGSPPHIIVNYRDANGVLKKWFMRNGLRGGGTTLRGNDELTDDAVDDGVYLTGAFEIHALVDFYSGEPDDCGNCTFNAYRDGELIYSETRNKCPQVELITDGTCTLSDTSNEVIVEKLPFLERIEVRNQKIETIYVSPLDAPLIQTSPLPDRILHVYKTAVSAPPILSEYVPIPGVFNPYQLVAELVSDEDCPSPEFEVNCDCSCRECPEGSCAAPCGSEICCNDTATGQLVETIPVEEYCEGGV